MDYDNYQNLNMQSSDSILDENDEYVINDVNCTDENERQNIKIGKVFNFEKVSRQTFISCATDIAKIKDMELQILIAKHKKSGVLETAERSTLARCIIRHILTEDFNRQIERNEFTIIAETITQMFTGEEAKTYFIPSHRGVPARGKLYSAYKSFRELLASANLISRRKRLKPTAKEMS